MHLISSPSILIVLRACEPSSPSSTQLAAILLLSFKTYSLVPYKTTSPFFQVVCPETVAPEEPLGSVVETPTNTKAAVNPRSAAVILIVLLSYKLYKTRNKKNMLKSIDNLNIRKNNLLSLPVLVELSKIEDIAKSEQLEEKVNDFKTRYDIIKDENLKNITDRINELDNFVDVRDREGFYNSFSEIELDLYGVETSLDSILSEIKDIASYEEKYRAIVIKLKNKYRILDKQFKEKENLYEDISEIIKIQFENIKKRFKDFDKVMEEKLYNEVILVVRSIDTMVDHLAIVLNELPDIMLLINDIIPLRIKDLQDEYEKLDKEGFPLLYLNIEGTINDVNKRCNDIYDKCRVLNITDSLFDLNNILSYLDNLFDEIEKEKTEKVEFELLNKEVSSKISSFENTMKSTYDQLDDIKELYDLKEKDLDIIEDINLSLLVDIKEYKKIISMVKERKTAYSNINILI